MNWFHGCLALTLAGLAPAGMAGNAGPAPAGMRYVPAGEFRMGDPAGRRPAELPVHTVRLDAFWIDRGEVSGELWDAVARWAATNGYEFADVPPAPPVHPVSGMAWEDCVKWCNARSEREGLAPVYCLDAAGTRPCRSGAAKLSPEQVRWEADGYRLPTEAEWEKAARGGAAGRDYPWAGPLDGSRANYWQSGHPYGRPDPYDDQSTPAGYYNGSQVPAGGDMANGYGLYDTAGNVWEYCWDWFDPGYYAVSPAENPRGPAAGRVRVIRGGAWNAGPDQLRCAFRSDYRLPSYRSRSCGLRCVRTARGKDGAP